MSEESTTVLADVRHLEAQIANLRLIVIILTIIVFFLSIYTLSISIPQNLFPILAIFGAIPILSMSLLYWECTKERSGAPAGT